MSKKFTLYSVLSAAALFAGSVPALAQTTDSRTIIVQATGLDLRSADGVAALRHRVSIAVRTVCGPAEQIGAPEFDSYAACTRDAAVQASRRSDALVASARGAGLYASAATPQ